MKKILTFCFVCALIVTAAAAEKAAIAPPAEGKFSGKVAETMDAGGYTYVSIDTGKEKVWVAAPKMQVKVGDAVEVSDGMAMEKYHSKTLNRDFDVVYFTGNITVNGRRTAEKTPDLPRNHPLITGSAKETKVDLSNIAKAKGGKTVAEVYAEKTKLNGKEVIIRGKVVKYNAGILGRNWIHLRDGTGSNAGNDLLVTSDTPVKVGDLILVTGKVVLNRDFGSSYKYDVMIENAKVVVEKSGTMAAAPEVLWDRLEPKR